MQKLLSEKKLRKIVGRLKEENKKIVLTLGSWDMLHVGHMRYIQQAKKCGDFLIVGVDSDRKIKERKGNDRPIVPQNERIEMLSHINHIDGIYLIDLTDTSISIAEIIKPDILVVSKTSQNKSNEKNLKKNCGDIIILPAQAETSTTAKIRKLHIDGMKKMYAAINKEILNIIKREIENI